MDKPRLRGLRGATTAEENTPEAILSATRELLVLLQARNQIRPEDIASAFFTVSPDLNAAYPAAAARELDWQFVPLLCTTEIPVPGGIERCIRVLLHVYTDRNQRELKHLYLKETCRLRPDLQGAD